MFRISLFCVLLPLVLSCAVGGDVGDRGWSAAGEAVGGYL